MTNTTINIKELIEFASEIAGGTLDKSDMKEFVGCIQRAAWPANPYGVTVVIDDGIASVTYALDADDVAYLDQSCGNTFTDRVVQYVHATFN